VGHPRGKPPQGEDLLRLDQLGPGLLELPAHPQDFPQVRENPHRAHFPVPDLDDGRRKVCGNDFPVFTHQGHPGGAELSRRAVIVASHAAHVFSGLLGAVDSVEQFGAVHDFFGLVAQDPFGSLVEDDHLALVVQDDDAVHGASNDAVEKVVGAAELALEFDVLGQIAKVQAGNPGSAHPGNRDAGLEGQVIPAGGLQGLKGGTKTEVFLLAVLNLGKETVHQFHEFIGEKTVQAGAHQPVGLLTRHFGHLRVDVQDSTAFVGHENPFLAHVDEQADSLLGFHHEGDVPQGRKPADDPPLPVGNHGAEDSNGDGPSLPVFHPSFDPHQGRAVCHGLAQNARFGVALGSGQQLCTSHPVKDFLAAEAGELFEMLVHAGDHQLPIHGEEGHGKVVQDALEHRVGIPHGKAAFRVIQGGVGTVARAQVGGGTRVPDLQKGQTPRRPPVGSSQKRTVGGYRMPRTVMPSEVAGGVSRRDAAGGIALGRRNRGIASQAKKIRTETGGCPVIGTTRMDGGGRVQVDDSILEVRDHYGVREIFEHGLKNLFVRMAPEISRRPGFRTEPFVARLCHQLMVLSVGWWLSSRGPTFHSLVVSVRGPGGANLRCCGNSAEKREVVGEGREDFMGNYTPAGGLRKKKMGRAPGESRPARPFPPKPDGTKPPCCAPIRMGKDSDCLTEVPEVDT